MRVLLPPSEAKTAGGRGRSLARREPHPSLGEPRRRLLDAVTTLVSGDRAAAASALLLPPSVVDDVLRINAVVESAPTRPALRRYAGVVYDGLALDTLGAAEQRLAARELFVLSGLFGVVRGDEPVPDYRVPAKAVLPGVGVAGTFWRPVLDEAMPALLGRGLVVDLRSSDYAAMWRPGQRHPGPVVQVRVLSRLPSGAWGVISYNSKFAKGRLAAALLGRRAAASPVTQADHVAAAWHDSTGLRAEVIAADRVEIYTDGQ